MLSAFVSRMVILLFGTLYPAYASYKAVRTKNVKEYVKWMMYWIVYAFFTCIETFTDIFLSWFPFYYEVKVILVIWLLSPATKGSSTLYRKFVHPMLTRREHEIDEYLNQAKEKGYTTVLQLGSKGMNYATSVIMQTAIKGGGNLVQTLKKSYSLSDLSEPDTQRTQDEIDEITRPQRTQRVLRPRTQSMRSASGGRNVPEMYFPEVDVPHSRTSRDGVPNYNYIRSSEDISSGYSSAEPMPVALSRTASLSHASRGATRLRSKRSEAGENSWEDDGEGDYPFSPSSCPQSPNSLSSMSSQNFQKFHYSSDGEPLFLVEEEDDPEMIDETRIMDVTENDPEFRQVFHVGKKQYDTKMEEKYRLFEIWLKNQQNSVKDPSSFSEDFQDTFSDHNSSEEEFHELDGGDNTESFPMLNEAQQEANNEEFPKCESNEIKEVEEPKELVIIEDTTLLTEDLNTNVENIKELKNESEEATKGAENDQTSILELERLDDDTITKEFPLKDDTIIPETVKEILPSSNKKTPCHSKGKAPEPPTVIPQISSPVSANEEEAAKSPEKKAISKKRENHLIELFYASAKPQNGENAQN
ncbi:uncharacterized protein LOC129796525 isoform X2 [Lutzomyia longipalpis]|uniref:uncharacterized protein LOC129796525 isoform X2 n=1 Tax=Lutzomyia longipalpis TaxID=7200 RepID=UPI002483A4B2|nr:uncharacterized protein LOC129796525 isoform X2 [Lutzomyia longipalpis]